MKYEEKSGEWGNKWHKIMFFVSSWGRSGICVFRIFDAFVSVRTRCALVPIISTQNHFNNDMKSQSSPKILKFNRIFYSQPNSGCLICTKNMWQGDKWVRKTYVCPRKIIKTSFAAAPKISHRPYFVKCTRRGADDISRLRQINWPN